MIPTTISEIAIKELSEEFGKNIPKSLQLDEGFLYFITHIFCVDENVNIEEICNKYSFHIGKTYKIEIQDYMYNNNYKIYINYKKEEPRYYLKL
jgi:hypothetical protein